MMNFIFLLQQAACHVCVVKKRNGNYSQINCREVNKQTSDQEMTGEHDSHTCCIGSVTQVEHFDSKWLISYAFV